MNDMMEMETVLREHIRTGNVSENDIDGIQRLIETILKNFGYNPVYMIDESIKKPIMFIIEKHYFEKTIAKSLSKNNTIFRQLKDLKKQPVNCLIIIKQKSHEV